MRFARTAAAGESVRRRGGVSGGGLVGEDMGGRKGELFEHGDRVNDFCVSRKNEDIPGVHGGGKRRQGSAAARKRAEYENVTYHARK